MKSRRSRSSGTCYLESVPFGVAAVILFALPSYTAADALHESITDSDFEEDNPVWEEIVTNERANADRHVQGGHGSGYCGLTDVTIQVSGGPYESWAELKQILASPRLVSELDSIEWWYEFSTLPKGIATFGVLVKSAQGDTLCYQYDSYGDRKDEAHFRVVDLDTVVQSAWTHERRKMGGSGGDWSAESLPADARVSEVSVYSKYVYAIGMNRGQKVFWDQVELWSTRYDHDASVVQIVSADSAPMQGTYIPRAEIGNCGAYPESLRVVCRLDRGGNEVYADTVVSHLEVDSTRQLSFKTWTPAELASHTMTVYTMLATEENPGNDTLMMAIGIYTGCSETADPVAPIFEVRPTIASSLLTVRSTSPMRIYDATGREVAKRGPGQGMFTLGSAGVYFVASGGEVRRVVRIK